RDEVPLAAIPHDEIVERRRGARAIDPENRDDRQHERERQREGGERAAQATPSPQRDRASLAGGPAVHERDTRRARGRAATSAELLEALAAMAPADRRRRPGRA